MTEQPVRVAVIGGGCAGMAAAWELSKQPGFEIHVYEKSWCLGGKAASARAADGRILEHGLHVWLGFYENAFRMMRECYEVVAAQGLGPKATLPQNRLAHGSFEDAFVPEPNVAVGHRHSDGKWAAWSGLFPPEPGLPGEPLDERSNPFTLANYLLRCVSLAKALMVSTIGLPDAYPGESRPNERSTSDQLENLNFSADSGAAGEVLIERAYRLLRNSSLTSAAVLQQAVTIFERWLQSLNFAPQVPGTALKLATAIATQTRKILRDVASIDPAIRAKADIIDIVVTIAVGLAGHLRTGLWLRGRRQDQACAGRGRRASRRAADVLHLSRRPVVAHALGHGRRRVRAPLQSLGRQPDEPTLAGQVPLSARTGWSGVRPRLEAALCLVAHF
jgi:hypothetical protein